MDPATLNAYVEAGIILVTVGKVAVDKVRAMFAESGMTEAELNTICDTVAADARTRAALAAADAGGPADPPA